jgi:hypothetical protein
VRVSLTGRFKRARKGNGYLIEVRKIIDLEAALELFRLIANGLGKNEAGLGGCGVVLAV